MVKRVGGGELIRLFFMSNCFFEPTERRKGAGELIVGQNQACISLRRIGPN